MKKKKRPPPPSGPPPAPKGSNKVVIDLTGGNVGRIKIGKANPSVSKGGIPRKPVQSSTSTEGSSKVSAPLKRPSRPGFKRPSTGNVKTTSVAHTKEIPRKSGSDDNGESLATYSTAAIPRRTSTSSSISSLIPKNSFKRSRLSNLVKNVASKNNSILDDNNDDDDMAMMMTNSSYGSNASPEDFFKNLREWDFVGDLARQQQESSSRTDNNNNNNKEDTTLPKKKPIPDTFISIRHYVSVWVPGILSETRAQILSEVLTEYGGVAIAPQKVPLSWST